jgi:spermidine synthase
VKKTGSTLCLQFNVRSDQRNQSCIDQRRPRAMVFSYTRMSMASLLFTERPQNILVIGLGGGTLPTAFNELYPKAHIDAVEIDPAVVTVAEKFFGFADSERLVVHTQDARVWTKRAALKPRRYDLIILDAFNGEYIPEHLMTREYLEETRALLAPGGTLVANTFSISHLYDHESVTYQQVFGDFINFRIPESSNRVVIVPGAEVDDAALKERAEALLDRLQPYSVPIRRYARILIRTRNSGPDWRTDARPLTDQYAPANLLQAQ